MMLLEPYVVPDIQGCIAVTWRGGIKGTASGVVIERPIYSVGSHVLRYDPLMTIREWQVDGIVMTSPCDGYIAWLLPSHVRLVQPGSVIALIRPDRILSQPLRAPRSADVPITDSGPIEPQSAQERKESATQQPAPQPSRPVPALVLCGDKSPKTWRHDSAAQVYIDEQAKHYEQSLGDMLDRIIWSWSCLSEGEKAGILAWFDQYTTTYTQES